MKCLNRSILVIGIMSTGYAFGMNNTDITTKINTLHDTIISHIPNKGGRKTAAKQHFAGAKSDAARLNILRDHLKNSSFKAREGVTVEDSKQQYQEQINALHAELNTPKAAPRPADNPAEAPVHNPAATTLDAPVNPPVDIPAAPAQPATTTAADTSVRFSAAQLLQPRVLIATAALTCLVGVFTYWHKKQRTKKSEEREAKLKNNRRNVQ